MKTIYLFLLLFVFHFESYSQDTFSICAYDSVTGQLGSAGATCIQSSTSAVIISDVVAGKGVVHTQASWLQANKNYAHSLLLQGFSPQQIVDSVTLHDAQGDSTIRQYGVVDVTGASAAFTGSNCLTYHNHITGPGYSIQGNILLGPQILDSIQSKFLNTPGDLACRLMAALQGAKVPGADTRCMSLGISTVSAFIRVANPSDTGANPLYLNISINTFPNYTEPIDSLQARFDLWGGCGASYVQSSIVKSGMKVFPNPAGEKLSIVSMQLAMSSMKIYDCLGIDQRVMIPEEKLLKNDSTIEIDLSSLEAGIYFLRAETTSGEIISTKIVKM